MACANSWKPRLNRQQIKNEIRRRLADPVDFQYLALGRTLWRTQRRIGRAILEKRSLAIKGCHASGKTYTVAGAALHHLWHFPQGKVITIAPTLRQVRLMWEEIEAARQSARIIRFPECSTTGMRISETHYGIGFSSSKGVNAQGFHGSDVLIIADEAPGISGDLWDAIEGIRAGGRVRLVKLGNPTVSSGAFYDDFTRGRGSVECITISAFDTPNLFNEAAGRPFTIEELAELPPDQLEYAPYPYLITRQWVLEKFKRWGVNNPRYQSRVLGAFPSKVDNALLDLAWIERARREPTEDELARAAGRAPGAAEPAVIQVGIDVAGPGDDETAACARVNGIVLDVGAWSDPDPRGAVVRWLGNLARLPYRLGPIVVDIVGVGWNFALHLEDIFPGRVFGFSAGRRAMDSRSYANAKAEAYFRLHDMYRENYICHEPAALDEECEAQLSAVQYRELANGQIEIEPKDEARKRGIQSPDRAEARVMAFCRVAPEQQMHNITSPYHISDY